MDRDGERRGLDPDPEVREREKAAAIAGGARVERRRGRCDRCGAGPVTVISSYDSRVYAGAACAACVLDGRASEVAGPDDAVMRPMVFIARAVLGQEPYVSLLREADRQRPSASRKDRRRAEAEARRAARRVVSSRRR